MEIKKVKFSTIAVSALIFFLVIVLTSMISIYKVNPNNQLSQFFTKLIPFPVVMIENSEFISFSELKENTESVKSFYENQDFSSIGVRIDFNTEKGQQRLKLKEKDVLNKMTEDKAIEYLANKNGIKVTNKMAEDSVSRKILESGVGNDFEANLKKLYKWELRDFEEKIVIPSLYSEELKKFVASNFLNEENSRIKSDVDEMHDGFKRGENFADAVNLKIKNEGSSRNGDMGWFKKEQLSKDLAEDIFKMNKGEISKPMESETGFHIIKIEDRKSENGIEMVKINQIFVPKKTFAEWLENEMKNMNIRVLSKEYRWNADNAVIEFR